MKNDRLAQAQDSHTRMMTLLREMRRVQTTRNSFGDTYNSYLYDQLWTAMVEYVEGDPYSHLAIDFGILEFVEK